jgi:cellulase/cellobiase CelA1
VNVAPPPPPPPPPTGGATFTVATKSEWATGYCVEVTVSNPTAKPLAWAVNVPLRGTLDRAWSATVTVSGQTLIAKGVSHNAVLDPKEAKRFGFCANL